MIHIFGDNRLLLNRLNGSSKIEHKRGDLRTNWLILTFFIPSIFSRIMPDAWFKSAKEGWIKDNYSKLLDNNSYSDLESLWSYHIYQNLMLAVACVSIILLVAKIWRNKQIDWLIFLLIITAMIISID